MVTVHSRARWIAPLALAACLQMIGGAQEIQTLSEAVRRVDIAALQRLIAQRVDVNRREPDGSTPLLWATYVGNGEAVTLLLNAGADPNTANLNGVTPLYQASARGDAVIVGRLLKAGAKVNTPVQLGETPLLAAAMTDSVETVRIAAGQRCRRQRQGRRAPADAADTCRRPRSYGDRQGSDRGGCGRCVADDSVAASATQRAP